MKIDERLITGFVIAIIFIIFLEIFGRSKVPAEFNDFITKVSSQESLMNKIGGYDSFELKYNSSELEKDSVLLSITIYGNNRKMTYKGYVRKKMGKWDLKTLQPIIKH
ncbi:MAG: hypothetical protein V4585_01595 [Bacteroidota bacterium]|jgi:hypothetical protein